MKNVIIRTEKLCKSFLQGKSEQKILRDINVEIYDKDFTVIMGSSGSGKSTFLYSISSMDKPTSGNVEILGNKITNYNEEEIAALRGKQLAFVFQSINLLPDLTAFENIAYPAYMTADKEEVNKKTELLLKKFDLEKQRDKYPSQMSGGQQQRIAIARALAKNPQIIFADEPTGALNSAAGAQVLDMMTALNNVGQSIVMVTHDIKACARGNRLLYLSDGKIEGELELGKYKPKEHQMREDKIFNFLKAHNW